MEDTRDKWWLNPNYPSKKMSFHLLKALCILKYFITAYRKACCLFQQEGHDSTRKSRQLVDPQLMKQTMTCFQSNPLLNENLRDETWIILNSIICVHRTLVLQDVSMAIYIWEILLTIITSQRFIIGVAYEMLLEILLFKEICV